MGRERLEDLLRRGHLRRALAEASERAARFDDRAESCTTEGEHGEATRAEREADAMRQIRSELQFRIALAERADARCAACGTKALPSAGAEVARVACPKCGREWDGEADLRFLEVVRAPVSQFGREVFVLAPPGRETGDEARLASFLSDRLPRPPAFAWHRDGVEVTIPPGTRPVRANELPVSGGFSLAMGGSLEFAGTKLRLRPPRPEA